MEDTDELEEDLSNGDITGSYDRLQGNVSKVDTKIDKFEGDRHVEIDNEKALSPGLERSETDSDTTYPSRMPVEIGSERLQMRNCPFFYIPDNTDKKKIAQVQSKVGSLDNINHSAGGGNKKIFSQKIDVTSITSRTNSGKRNTSYPTALPVKSIRTSSAKANASKQAFQPAAQVHSKIGSLKNVNHIPGGGDKKIHTYRIPDYKHKVSSKLDSSDPTPSVHQLKSNIDELVCDEVIHYHSRYKHTGRPHSAPAKHERSLHPFPYSGLNILDSSKHISLERGPNLHIEDHVTESSSKNTSRDT